MTRPALLITGASTGIGAATARLAAEAGWDIGLHYRASEEAALAVAEECRARGARAELMRADLGEEGSVDALFAAWDAAFPSMQGLVNNAGAVDVAATVAEMDEARITRMMRLNVTAAFLVAGAAVRRMSTEAGGSGGVIVNMSSAAARLASANLYVDYAASKAAIDVLTMGLAQEAGPLGIRVNGIRPGLIETEIHAKGGQPGRAQRLAHTVPMRRTGSAEEVAEAAVWLLSEKSSYVSASNIDVGGGR